MDVRGKDTADAEEEARRSAERRTGNFIVRSVLMQNDQVSGLCDRLRKAVSLVRCLAPRRSLWGRRRRREEVGTVALWRFDLCARVRTTRPV